MVNRIKNALMNEEGSGNLQEIILIAVVLAIAVFFFLFRNKISEFLKTATGKIGDMENQVNTIDEVPTVDSGLTTP